MQLKPKALEQHIAVFGESGSGKTVLVSSFYGGTQEPKFLSSSLFDVTADDTGQGHQLHANYLGLKDSRVPETTRFSSTPYAFSIKLRDKGAKADSPKPFDALRLVWHDYPGEWFDNHVSDPEVAQRRVATFKSLLSSDVAFLLVDGQRLLDNAGEEERYLKSLLHNFRTGLLRLEDQLLDDGKLVRFPRIWVLALSKADLLPELDVFGFRDLVISKAFADLDELRKVLAGLVESPDALSVGEDFVRLSSAKFEPDSIKVTERIGLDLVLPLSAMLPFERHSKWVDQKKIPTKVAADLLEGVADFGAALIDAGTPIGPKRHLLALLGRRVVNAAYIGAEQLAKMNSEALAKKDYMAAVLTRFGMDLGAAEEGGVLLRSKK